MKYLFSIMLVLIVLTGCNTHKEEHKEEHKNENSQSDSFQSDHEDKHDHNYIKDGKKLKTGLTKVYPLTKLKTTTIDKQLKVLDNDTVIYTEDTGHGIPTKPAGEGHQFHAILEAEYKKNKMYMLEDGTFMTADPKHVKVISSGHSPQIYPAFKMHEDDEKYLKSLNKDDPDYKAYEQYLKKFAERQFDYTRELLMHTAVHEVNNKTPESLVIPEEKLKTFEQFKKKK